MAATKHARMFMRRILPHWLRRTLERCDSNLSTSEGPAAGGRVFTGSALGRRKAERMLDLAAPRHERGVIGEHDLGVAQRERGDDATERSLATGESGRQLVRTATVESPERSATGGT